MHAVVGHRAIQQRFVRACLQKKLPHAWMLYGMQGIGKSTLAAHLAQTALCSHADAALGACGHCHSCRIFLAESHPDFLYITRLWQPKKKAWARDISVDQVREMLSFLALTGMRSQRRVVLVDDANRMNKSAANALLKGLEEPGSDVLLLMVCHDISALPETVRSRCMLEHCMPLADDDARQVLHHMALSDDVLPLAVRLAQGCPGSVVAFQEDEVAQACLQWQAMISPLPKADMGDLDAWLHRYVSKVPHHLLVHMFMQEIQPYMQRCDMPYALAISLHQAVMALLAWSQDVRAYTLRPAPSLLNHIIQVRKLLPSLPSVGS